jgi:hypothetical protein
MRPLVLRSDQGRYAQLVVLAAVVGVLAALGNLGFCALIEFFTWVFLKLEWGAKSPAFDCASQKSAPSESKLHVFIRQRRRAVTPVVNGAWLRISPSRQKADRSVNASVLRDDLKGPGLALVLAPVR